MWHFSSFNDSVPRCVGSPDPSSTISHPRRFLNGLFYRSLRTLPVVYVSAVIDVGSHPFPFRTRKLSRLSPMVLGLRARESRSLQDSRPLGRKRPRGLFLYPLHSVPLSRPCPVSTGHLSLTCPLSKDRGPLRLYRPLALHPGMDAPASARSHLKVAATTRQYESLVAHAPCCKQRVGLFLYPRCHARAGGHLLAGPEPVTGRPRRTRGWRATTCEPGGGLPLTEYICIQILYGFD